VSKAAGHTAADIVMFLFLVPQFLIAVKRAHDRNISTWVVSGWLVMLATTDFFGWLPTRINLNVFSPPNLLLFAYTMIAGIISWRVITFRIWRNQGKSAGFHNSSSCALMIEDLLWLAGTSI
jgi:uncharacterized membrane protein YhaH (DUF805 family)